MKYLQAVANWYVNGDFRIEDSNKIKRELEQFDEIKNQLPQNKKDPNKFKSSVEVYELIQNTEAVTSNKQKMRDIKHKGAEVYYKDNQITVIHPKTWEAACFYGKGTRWCTASKNSDNEFKSYNKEGPLYIIITHDNLKFQFHFESGQFMDVRDQPVRIAALIKIYPSLKKAFKEQLMIGISYTELERKVKENPNTLLLFHDITGEAPVHLQKISIAKAPWGLWDMVHAGIKPPEEVLIMAVEAEVHSISTIEQLGLTLTPKIIEIAIEQAKKEQYPNGALSVIKTVLKRANIDTTPYNFDVPQRGNWPDRNRLVNTTYQSNPSAN